MSCFHPPYVLCLFIPIPERIDRFFQRGERNEILLPEPDAKEDWVVAIGHHPVYAETPKAENERADMQRRIGDILRRHRVDIYASGHIHNFQHLRVKGTDTDFVVNSSSLARKVSPVEGTVFCSPLAGFSVIAADKHELNLHFIDSKGNVIHTVHRTK